MNKIKLGILLGIIVGIIDVIPMVIQKLTWDANISAFLLWVVVGLFIATTNLKITGAIKGVVISFLVLLPSAVIIGWQQPVSLIPILLMTLILGSTLGFLIEKHNK